MSSFGVLAPHELGAKPLGAPHPHRDHGVALPSTLGLIQLRVLPRNFPISSGIFIGLSRQQLA